MLKFISKNITLLCCLIFIQFVGAQTVFRGTVFDAETKKPISGAKVGVTGQGIGEITSENGRFVYRKYHQVIDGSHQLEVSATAYQSLEMPSEELRTLLNKNATIYLQPLPSNAVKDLKEPTKAHVVWDASISSGLRDPDKELDFLLEYLKQSTVDSIHLTIFNKQLVYDELLPVADNSEVIKKRIQQTTYEGASDYNLLPIVMAEEVILFTEAPPTFGESHTFQDTPIRVIHSSVNKSHQSYFQRLTTYTSGTYINVQELSPNGAVKYLLYGETPVIKEVATSERIITGTVISGNGPVHYATISKEGSLDETYSKEDGTFKIIGTTGDVFKVMYLGKFNQSFTVTDQDDYTITMTDSSEVLDEVEITAKRNRYDFNPNKSSDVFEGANVAVRSLHISELNPNATSASELINGKFGVVSNDRSTFVKGLEAEWVVDGVVMLPSQVSPKNIIRISVHRPETFLANISTPRPRAKIIVTTKFHKDYIDAHFRKLGYTPQEKNIYSEEPPLLSFEPTASNYLTEINKIESLEKKWEAYNKLRSKHAQEVDFYVDLTLYFEEFDADLARKVRSDFTVVAMHNVKALRILAYLHEYAGAYLEAQKVYERILLIAPGQAESYRDLALIYQETGEYQKALELYINMLGGGIKGVDFSELERAISNELQHLVVLHKPKIDYQRLPNDWLGVDFNIDIRMTLAWSTSDAPFEFQFVNPNNRFYNWNSENNITGDLKRKRLVEEFIVDNAPKGKWLVNVRFTGEPGNASVAPYLKYTLYKNYGKPNESKTIKLVKLDDQLEKVTLDSFIN